MSILDKNRTRWVYKTASGGDIARVPIPAAPFLQVAGNSTCLILEDSKDSYKNAYPLLFTGIGGGGGISIPLSFLGPVLNSFGVTFALESFESSGSYVYSNPVWSNPNLKLDDLKGTCILLSLSIAAINKGKNFSLLFMGCRLAALENPGTWGAAIPTSTAVIYYKGDIKGTPGGSVIGYVGKIV